MNELGALEDVIIKALAHAGLKADEVDVRYTEGGCLQTNGAALAARTGIKNEALMERLESARPGEIARWCFEKGRLWAEPSPLFYEKVREQRGQLGPKPKYEDDSAFFLTAAAMRSWRIVEGCSMPPVAEGQKEAVLQALAWEQTLRFAGTDKAFRIAWAAKQTAKSLQAAADEMLANEKEPEAALWVQLSVLDKLINAMREDEGNED